MFLTADTAGALPLITQLLRDNGVDPGSDAIHRPDPLGYSGGHAGAARRAGRLVRPARSRALCSSIQAAIRPPSARRRIRFRGLAYDGIAAIGALVKQGKGDA